MIFGVCLLAVVMFTLIVSVMIAMVLFLLFCILGWLLGVGVGLVWLLLVRFGVDFCCVFSVFLWSVSLLLVGRFIIGCGFVVC